MKNGDIIITDTAEDETVGKAIEVYGVDKCPAISGLHTIACRPVKNLFEFGYLGYLINSSPFHKQLRPFMQGIKVTSINRKYLSQTKIKYPGKREQRKVVELMTLFDILIALHETKLNYLKKYKRGLIFHLYPLKDQSTPKIRINGFKDPWTKIRLCDVLDEFIIKSSRENEYEVLSSTNAGIEFRKGRVSGTSNKGYKIIDINDLVLSPQNLWLGNININHLAKGIVSPSYKTYKIHDIVIDFFEPVLHTKEMLNNYAQSSVQGASVVRRNLDINLFNSIEISVPSKEEQTAIGKMLKSIDKLIIGLEKEIDLIIEYKRALISKMFI